MKWLRDPLLHFLLLGVALFILYGLQNDQPADDSNRIVISEADIDRLLTLWEKRWQRPPTPAEIDGVIAAQVREEVLYREALAMGLDQGDSVVRRRLAQKMEFIFSDIASQAEPNEDELIAYLEAHADSFEVPARISFVQVYLNAAQRGEQANEDAARLFDELKKPDSTIDFSAAGDAFMFGQQHLDLTRRRVTALFGEQFAEQVFNLSVGGWQEPVTSAYGLHLVRVDKKSEASTPLLAEVRDNVINEWQNQQRKTVNEQFYQGLRTRYEVIVEDYTAQNGTTRISYSGNVQ
ncbi:MAG: peptidylprolyl isomerase [Gammaproteobacteria bacterium]|nr:MAG: peptidylprolyl isomerase [Gammaproteobacteria bacterium]